MFKFQTQFKILPSGVKPELRRVSLPLTPPAAAAVLAEAAAAGDYNPNPFGWWKQQQQFNRKSGWLRVAAVCIAAVGKTNSTGSELAAG
jgi:hypothetical protein